MSINLNQKKKNILVMILILVILLLIIIYFYKIAEKNRDINDIKAEVYEEMMQEMVMPNGIFMLKKNYKGKNDLQEFYKSINNLYREMIKLSKMDEKKVEKYYNSNKKEIELSLRIKEFEKFKQLSEYSKSQGKLKSIISANIDTESFKDTGDSLNFNMNLIFDENRLFDFKVELDNRKKSNSFVEYQILENK